VDVYPLDPLGLAEPDPRLVDRGWARAINRGLPLTVDQALAKGLQAMLDEDEAEELAADPIAYAAARRPRRLIDVLRRRA
jgi:hypothetical protein